MAPFASIGVAIAGLFFAASALMGNALITNANIESGDPVPRFSRTVVLLVVVIYKYVDPIEFLILAYKLEKTNKRLWGLFRALYLEDVDIGTQIQKTTKEITMESSL
ncbi:hypothetical protein LEP1GSC126_0055 [Leptospira kirschneri str. 200801774]|nr:hypothetical protein LEP1GSC126_0055 [Leptospira kirschneri str. 200801774]